MKILSAGGELLHTDGRTDGQAKLTVAFHKFAEGRNEYYKRKVQSCFREKEKLAATTSF